MSTCKQQGELMAQTKGSIKRLDLSVAECADNIQLTELGFACGDTIMSTK